MTRDECISKIISSTRSNPTCSEELYFEARRFMREVERALNDNKAGGFFWHEKDDIANDIRECTIKSASGRAFLSVSHQGKRCIVSAPTCIPAQFDTMGKLYSHIAEFLGNAKVIEALRGKKIEAGK